ncbi:MAG TPA: twin-arginine translocation signal domain-containing protein, partial [Planctomycetes bacterium]|nr:twin-arginine translocation signal domain-containing protein [Planctomycetota bacterium]
MIQHGCTRRDFLAGAALGAGSLALPAGRKPPAPRGKPN